MNVDLKSFSLDLLLKLQKSISIEIKKRSLHENSEKTKIKALRNYANQSSLNEDIQKVNSENLFALPLKIKSDYVGHRKYYQSLMNQDWGYLFSEYENESIDYYVYAHLDPKTKDFGMSELNLLPGKGVPFYIGKGCGIRAFELNRNQGHGKKIKAIVDDGYSKDCIPKILVGNISERKAMEIESKLIYFFGTIYEENRIGILLNLDLSKRPVFNGVMHHFLTKKIISKIKNHKDKARH